MAIKRQAHEIQSLDASNLELWGESQMLEIERYIWDEVEEVLKDPSLMAALSDSSAAAGHAKLEQLVSDRGLATAVFVLGPSGEVRQSRPGLHARLRSLLRSRLGGPIRLHPGRLYTDTIEADKTDQQVFYLMLETGGPVYGLILNPAWVSNELAHMRLTTPGGGGRTVLAKLERVVSPAETTGTSSGALVLAFRTLFPNYNISIPRTELIRRESQARRELIFLFASCALFLTVLVVGGVIMTRIIREFEYARFRTDLLHSFSHDLRSPLVVIRLYSETIATGRLTKDEQNNYCGIIIHETDHLNRLLESALTFSQVQRPQRTYHLRSGNLAQHLAANLQTHLEHLRLRGYEVHLGIDEKLPPVQFDPDAIDMAVLNLVDNARKYGGERKFVGVRLYRREAEIVLEVEDHGIGIAPEHQKQIFSKFFRAPDTAKQKGFGLGLYLVRHTMKGHGGRVELASVPGEGSTFRLVFPLGRSTAKRFFGGWLPSFMKHSYVQNPHH
ncbi:MAG: sensor histidine kinase [Acidobacteria bacterium]|nr:MAG: sensor histidine kinase [Acidobacteriota bacterium]